MQRCLVVGCLVAVGSLGLLGCGEAEAAPVSESALVLELGGDHEPLGAALRAAGVVDEPPAQATPRSVPPATVPPATVPPAGGPATTEPAATAPAPVLPQPPPPAAAADRLVELGEGQTLYELARIHLGSAGRFRELLELNGWSERQAKRLTPGTRVRLPAR